MSALWRKLTHIFFADPASFISKITAYMLEDFYTDIIINFASFHSQNWYGLDDKFYGQLSVSDGKPHYLILSLSSSLGFLFVWYQFYSWSAKCTWPLHGEGSVRLGEWRGHCGSWNPQAQSKGIQVHTRLEPMLDTNMFAGWIHILGSYIFVLLFIGNC